MGRAAARRAARAGHGRRPAHAVRRRLLPGLRRGRRPARGADTPLVTDRADVVVVGGGVTGASVAAHLAARGIDVLLLERHALAYGPTGRSTAIVRQYYTHPLLVRMAVHGLR